MRSPAPAPTRRPAAPAPDLSIILIHPALPRLPPVCCRHSPPTLSRRRTNAEINENNLPAELFPGYTTVEYQMENKNPRPPCFLIVLDTAMSAEELQDAKDSLGQLVALLPEECLVGLITFGATVTVHELCDGNAFPKSYVLRGTDDVTQDP